MKNLYRFLSWSLAAVLLFCFLGCGGAGGDNSVRGRRSAAPDAATGAPLTIVLGEFMSDAWQDAQSLQQRAQRVLDSSDVRIDETKLGLSVRYGRFNRYGQAESAFERVRAVYDQLSLGAYQFCYIYDVPKPDPPMPRDWDLYDSDCKYSIEIATYYNVPEEDYFDRKEDAVRAVEALREDGERAYLVHGSDESRVYVGCYPDNIVQPAYVNGREQQVINPLVEAKLGSLQYRYENGAVVTRIVRAASGQVERIPQPPALVNIDALWQEQPF